MRSPAIIAAMLLLSACGGDAAQNETAGAPGENAASSGPSDPVSAAPKPAEPGRVSQFTKLDAASCGPERVIEETGDWERTCRGAAGYTLEWSSGDLRENLAIRDGTARTALDIPVKVATGAFDAIGTTLEWRGFAGQRPDVLVARVHVANDQGENDGGHLTVIRLGAEPCIVAVVRPQAGQSERARAIADGNLPDCLAD